MLNANDIVHLNVGKCDSCILVKKKNKSLQCKTRRGACLSHIIKNIRPR